MLKVLQLNCRGYYSNRHLIAEVLHEEDPDVVLLNDTGVLPPNRSIKHYGYTTRTTQTHAPHDGVAILVKTHLRHDFLATWLSPHFLAVRIHTLREKIIIATTYTRPNAGLPYADINTLFNYTHIPVYLLADLNAQHTAFHHTRCNPHGRQLDHIITRKRLRFLGPDFPTTFTGNGTGRPDLAIANRQTLHLHNHLSPGRLCGSNHIPLILRFSSNPIAIPSRPHFQFSRADWDACRDTHMPIQLENQHYTTIDTYIDNIHEDIRRAANTHIPTAEHKIF